jgi:hypothetical protein
MALSRSAFITQMSATSFGSIARERDHFPLGDQSGKAPAATPPQMTLQLLDHLELDPGRGVAEVIRMPGHGESDPIGMAADGGAAVDQHHQRLALRP